MTSAPRSDGRWHGRLTSRPLPEDPAIKLLSAEAREAIADVWIGRAASEARVATSFAIVRDALREMHADDALVRLADRAVDDEHRHAELCRVVASRFAGTELEPPVALPHVYPLHPSASDALRPTLWIVGHSVLNETTASAFLQCCLEHATGTLARAALRELLSDEIDHARIGWAHLASLARPTRVDLGAWMPRLARANLRIWRETVRPAAAGPEVVAHAQAPAHAIDHALVAATEELIVPGCDHLGIPTEALRAWLAAGAPTAA